VWWLTSLIPVVGEGETHVAEIVAAAAAVHAPQLLSRPPHEDPVKLDGSTDALRRFGSVLDETQPDAILLIGLDHLETFWLEAVPAFTLVLSPEVTAHYMATSKTVPVHTELAKHLLKGVIAQDFDLTYSQEAVLGHAFLTPLEYIVGDRPIPIIPLLVNTYLPPIPSPRRAFALGEAIGRALATRPERIAVIASGGMSHFPGTTRYHSPNFAFDEWVLGEVAAGRWDDLLDLSAVNLDEVGESELMTWFTALGVIGRVPGTLLSYQELSHHGHGVVQFLPAGADGVSFGSGATVPRYGGHEFTQTDHVYYRFPEPDSLPLNRMLHRLIIEQDYRTEFVRHTEAVVAAAGLRPQESAAILSSESFDALVEVGAHPLLALSARQVSELERQRLAAAGA
jgi:aromatic ring-opening dioxygenase catalytic subunit (LigB family)